MNKSPEITQPIHAEIVGAYAETVRGQELSDSHRIQWRHPVIKFGELENPYRITDTLKRRVGEVASRDSFPERFIEFPFEESVQVPTEALCPFVCIVGSEFLEGPRRKAILEKISQRAVKEVVPIPIKWIKYPSTPLEKDEEIKPTMRTFVMDQSDYFLLRETIKSELIDDFFLDLANGSFPEKRTKTDSFGVLALSGTLSAKEYDQFKYFLASRTGDKKEIKRYRNVQKYIRSINASKVPKMFENFQRELFAN